MDFLLVNWQLKLVTVFLIWAAYIDGKELRVPNWMTYPMIFAGLIYAGCVGGYDGFQTALWGATVGMLCLLPIYAVGGMGAGDVKMMAGMGAWVGASVTFNAFVATTIVGAVMAIAMVLYRNAWNKHFSQFFMILNEWSTIRNPAKLSEIAAERKPSMLLLPYGIPICIGSIGYFLFAHLY